jgi:predicted ATPase
VQWILQVGACLGYKFDPKLLETAKAVLPGEPIDDVEKNLELCFNASLLERLSDGRVIFLHEKIHRAALELLPQGEDLEKLHLRIGLLLSEQIKSQRQSDLHILFLCADQLSEGSNHVDQVSTKLQLAELYDMVGRKAIKLSAFGTAATYFTLGIKHLDDIGNMWRDYKLLCNSLFVNLAEVEFNVGKLDASMEAVEEVLANRPSKSAIMRATLTRLSHSEGRVQVERVCGGVVEISEKSLD